MFSEKNIDKRATKRLKVGRACYTCRAKKIKCDGLRPCMQCKARQRPCSFYKDGSLETEQTNDDVNDINEIHDIDINDQTSLSSSITRVTATSITPVEGSILFAETSTINHSKLKRRGPLMESRISNALSSLGENMRKMATTPSKRLAEKLLKSSEGYGSFIMWMPEPSLPSRYSGSIEMPPREIQFALIDQYFNERHESIGMIIKFHFYEQLETKGLMITPLLLNTIYAHASRFVDIPGCPKTEVFYHRARRLVEDFMDVPRVSTVVALYLLSLYEPSPSIYRPGSPHCRQWQYSGMACRMSLELGLHDDTNVHSSLTTVEIELRRRVFWGCYDLDKFQSGGWERPWMISKSFIRTSIPSLLPQETKDDSHVIDLFNAKLRFLKIVEDNLSILSESQAFLNESNIDDQFFAIRRDSFITKIKENLTQHQIWLRSLEPNMQWTPVTTLSVKDILEIPASRPMVGHLHLYYNALTLDLLRRLPNDSLAQFQSRVAAASMTQLAHHLCQTPSYVVKFDFIVHALISAIKVHIHYLDDTDTSLAQQAWLLFDRSIWCMQFINNYAVIPNCLKFLQQVQNIYGLHMTDNQPYRNSGSLSPRNSTNSNNTSKPNKQGSSSSLNIQSGLNTQSSLRTQSTLNDQTERMRDKSSSLLQKQKSTISQHHQPQQIMTAESSHSSRKIIDTFPDDINQILTDWAPTDTNTNNKQQHQQNIVQLESTNNDRNNEIVYLNTHNTQLNHTYHQFNVNISNRTPQPHGYQQSSSTTNTSFQNNSPPNTSTHIRTQSNNLPVWNDNGRFNNTNKNLSYDTREIMIPTQLNEDSSAENTSMYHSNTRFSNDSSIWQAPPGTNEETVEDGDTRVNRGLGIYMTSRQHYEDMIKGPPTPQ